MLTELVSIGLLHYKYYTCSVQKNMSLKLVLTNTPTYDIIRYNKYYSNYYICRGAFMGNTQNSSNRLEDQAFMSLSIFQIKEEADKVISDRKKNTLQIEWDSGDYTINIEIKKSIQLNDKIDSKKMSKEETEVVKRLAEGQKQVQVAKEMGISQAKVSGIKNKYAALLTTLMASALPIVGGIIGAINKGGDK